MLTEVLSTSAVTSAIFLSAFLRHRQLKALRADLAALNSDKKGISSYMVATQPRLLLKPRM